MTDITSNDELKKICIENRDNNIVLIDTYKVDSEVVYNSTGETYGDFRNDSCGFTIEKPQYQRHPDIWDKRMICDYIIAVMLGICQKDLNLHVDTEKKSNYAFAIDGQNRYMKLKKFVYDNLEIEATLFIERLNSISRNLKKKFPALIEAESLAADHRKSGNPISYNSLLHPNYTNLRKNFDSPYNIEIIFSEEQLAILHFQKLNENGYAHTDWNKLRPMIYSTKFFKDFKLTETDGMSKIEERMNGSIFWDKYFQYFATSVQNKKSFGAAVEAVEEIWYTTALHFFDISKNKMAVHSLTAARGADIFDIKESRRDGHISNCVKYKTSVDNKKMIDELFDKFFEFFDLAHGYETDFYKKLDVKHTSCIKKLKKQYEKNGRKFTASFATWIKLKSSPIALITFFVRIFSYYENNTRNLSFAQVFSSVMDYYNSNIGDVLEKHFDDIYNAKNQWRDKYHVINSICDTIIQNSLDDVYDKNRFYRKDQVENYTEILFGDEIDFNSNMFLFYDLGKNPVLANKISPDHSMPHKSGGKTSFDNFVPMSLNLNEEKGGFSAFDSPTEYYDAVIEKMKKEQKNNKTKLKTSRIKLTLFRTEEMKNNYIENKGKIE